MVRRRAHLTRDSNRESKATDWQLAQWSKSHTKIKQNAASKALERQELQEPTYKAGKQQRLERAPF